MQPALRLQYVTIPVGEVGAEALKILLDGRGHDNPQLLRDRARHALAMQPVQQAQAEEAPGLRTGHCQQVAVVNERTLAGHPACRLPLQARMLARSGPLTVRPASRPARASMLTPSLAAASRLPPS